MYHKSNLKYLPMNCIFSKGPISQTNFIYFNFKQNLFNKTIFFLAVVYAFMLNWPETDVTEIEVIKDHMSSTGSVRMLGMKNNLQVRILIRFTNKIKK